MLKKILISILSEIQDKLFWGTGILSYYYTYSNVLFQLHSLRSVMFHAFIRVTKTPMRSLS